MAGNLALLRAAATALIDHFGPNDLAKVGTFGEEITISPRFTRDVGELLRSLPTSIPPNAPTPLWEAADKAMTDLSQPGERESGRPVVLIMSDGKDSPPPMFRRKWYTQMDAAERAEREDVMIYGIGVYSRMMPGGDIRQQIVGRFPDPGLGTVAEDSGGGYYELRPRDDLGAEFARITDELHHQYLLGFAPPSRDGKTHKIEVKVARKDLKVRARKAYKAPK
jgi:VWFA-related protein